MSACTSEPVSWLRLERYALGELTGAAADTVRDHLAGCAVCSASLARIEGDTRALPPLPAVPAPRRFWTWPRLAWSGGLLAAVAVLVLVLRPDRGGQVADDAPAIARVKGGTDATIALVRDRGGAITEEAATFAERDRFQVRMTCAAPSPVFVDVVVFQRGEVSFPLPPAQVRCGNDVTLPGAFTITGGDATVCVAIDPMRSPDRTALTSPQGLACATLAADGPPPRAGMCDELLSPAVRDAHFPGATLVDEELPRHMAAAGCLLPMEQHAAHVYVLCADESGHAGLSAALRERAADVVELPAGFAGTHSGRTVLQLRASRCLVTVHGFSGAVKDLAAALTTALTPELADRIRALAP